MYINELEDVLAELAEQKPKILITSLLEFLTEDIYWLESNLTEYHIAIINQLSKLVEEE